MKMIDLLEQERKLLLAGALKDAINLQDRKLEYLQALEVERIPSIEAHRIRRLAERNASLIDAARRGVASARRTLEDPAEARALITYSANGVQKPVRQVTQKIKLRF